MIRTILAALLLTACVHAEPSAPPTPPVASATPVLSTDRTVLGQYFGYPVTAPLITATIVTLPPEAETGLHRHDVPLFGYMLEGELTVDYLGRDNTVTQRTYLPGEALMEAIGTPHNGRNTGSGDVRILAVFIGAEGIPNTVKEE